MTVVSKGPPSRQMLSNGTPIPGEDDGQGGETYGLSHTIPARPLRAAV
ncbi:hypothetical protein [Nonomuraea sp. bgisy101]